MELRRGVIRGGVDVGYVPEWAPSPCRWHPCGFRVEGGKTQIRVPEMTVVGADRGTPPRVGYRSVIVKDRADDTLYLDEPGLCCSWMRRLATPRTPTRPLRRLSTAGSHGVLLRDETHLCPEASASRARLPASCSKRWRYASPFDARIPRRLPCPWFSPYSGVPRTRGGVLCVPREDGPETEKIKVQLNASSYGQIGTLIKTYYVVLHVNYFELLILTVYLLVYSYITSCA
jgi:hypothetical protein